MHTQAYSHTQTHTQTNMYSHLLNYDPPCYNYPGLLTHCALVYLPHRQQNTTQPLNDIYHTGPVGVLYMLEAMMSQLYYYYYSRALSEKPCKCNKKIQSIKLVMTTTKLKRNHKQLLSHAILQLAFTHTHCTTTTSSQEAKVD